MIKRLTLLVVLVTFLPGASTVLARMDISPYVTLQQEYHDNIDLTADNEEEDWITTVAPGIRLNYDARSVTADIDYSLRYRFYKNNSDDDQDRFKDVQRARASLVFFQGRPFTLTLSENIARETLDERDPYAPENERVNATTVYRTRISPQYRQQLTATSSAVVAYVYDRVDYVDDAGEDMQSHTARLSLIKALNPNLDVSANYRYAWHLSELSNEDYDTQSYTLGVDYRIGSRTQLRLEGGYSLIEYEDGDDNDSVTADAELSYRITAPLTLSLLYSQSYSASATNGASERRQAGLRLGYDRERLTASSELFWRQVDYLRTDREDDAYGVRAAIGYQLMRNVHAEINGDYEIADYQPDNEEVKTLGLGAALRYDYRIFNASLGYRYRDRNADTATSEYTSNVVTLTVSARF